jgi:hypothetical protein
LDFQAGFKVNVDNLPFAMEENKERERLPYLDNLLAGVFKRRDHARKDQHLFEKVLRDGNDIKPYLCNTRHSYNGAIRSLF